MNINELIQTRDTLIETIADLKERLQDEQDRFLQSGIRMHGSCVWRSYTKQKITNFNQELIEVNKLIMELQSKQTIRNKLLTMFKG